MTESINGNLSARVTISTSMMEWSSSPSGTVWRKRVHLVGEPESGQVTSVVRYEPGASFPAHDHPEGEEILVLDGVFSDEHGDWPAGTYLLNPEGFRHAPFSLSGCLLFVKLRQFPGCDREHHTVDTNDLEWIPTSIAGVARKALYSQTGFADVMRLERWDAGTDLGRIDYVQGIEFFVLEGEFEDDEGTYPVGSWLRLPPGGFHCPRTSAGCTIYMKLAGFPYLRSGDE
jgi:anti-sigma factor ChrR (cupin superfamily)